MSRLKPLIVSLATATALSIVPMSFGTLPITLGVTTAEAASTVSINIFFQPLASHGVWVKHSKYRYVFCPKVDAKWRPYSHGHWIYMKNYGWYFASDEPFAWAVYHYGRWVHEKRIGWCWVPGNAWAGAWVAWRRSNDYVGWAPLPPSREGFAVNIDFGNQEPPREDWVFIPPKRFLEPQLNAAIVFGDQQPDAFDRTQYVGPVVVQNNIVVNTVIDVNFIQQQTGQQVKEVAPQPVNDPAQAAADANGDAVAVFAPQIDPPKQDEAPTQAVDEAQAPAQNGNGDQSSSASSEQPSSAEASSSAASSEAVSSASSEQPASSSEAASSPVSSSSEAAPAPASSSSEAAPAPSSSEEQPPASSSEAAPASSEEQQPAPASSSEQAAPASSEEQAAPSSLECPEGFEIVDGKCVPIQASGTDTPVNGDQSSAAQ